MNHKGVEIPEQIWNFFNTQDGFTTDQLYQAIDNDLEKNPYRKWAWSNKLRMISRFNYEKIFHFYNQTPQLSVSDLLQYDEYAIRDFICHDKNFQFHQWIIKNNLVLPLDLVSRP